MCSINIIYIQFKYKLSKTEYKSIKKVKKIKTACKYTEKGH